MNHGLESDLHYTNKKIQKDKHAKTKLITTTYEAETDNDYIFRVQRRCNYNSLIEQSRIVLDKNINSHIINIIIFYSQWEQINTNVKQLKTL